MKTTFKISINDGFCEWTYPVQVSCDSSIDSVMKKISEALKIANPKGELRSESYLENPVESLFNGN